MGQPIGPQKKSMAKPIMKNLACRTPTQARWAVLQGSLQHTLAHLPRVARKELVHLPKAVVVARAASGPPCSAPFTTALTPATDAPL